MSSVEPIVPKYSRPPGVLVTEKGDTVIYRVSWWGKGFALFALFFLVCWYSMLAVILGVNSLIFGEVAGALFSEFEVFGQLFVIVVTLLLALGGTTLAYVFWVGHHRGTTLELDRDRLALRSPLAWRKALIVPRAEIQQVYLTDVVGKKGRVYRELNVLDSGDNKIRIFAGHPDSMSYFKQELRSRLVLSDRPVVGEVQG